MVTDSCASTNYQRIDQHLIFLGGSYSVLYHVSDLFQHLLNLTGKHTYEDDVALSCHLLVIEEALNSKLLLEGSQQMRLTSGHNHLKVVELVLDLQELGQENRANLPTANDSYFEVGQLLASTWQVCHGDLILVHALCG